MPGDILDHTMPIPLGIAKREVNEMLLTLNTGMHAHGSTMPHDLQLNRTNLPRILWRMHRCTVDPDVYLHQVYEAYKTQFDEMIWEMRQMPPNYPQGLTHGTNGRLPDASDALRHTPFRLATLAVCVLLVVTCNAFVVHGTGAYVRMMWTAELDPAYDPLGYGTLAGHISITRVTIAGRKDANDHGPLWYAKVAGKPATEYASRFHAGHLLVEVDETDERLSHCDKHFRQRDVVDGKTCHAENHDGKDDTCTHSVILAKMRERFPRMLASKFVCYAVAEVDGAYATALRNADGMNDALEMRNYILLPSIVNTTRAVIKGTSDVLCYFGVFVSVVQEATEHVVDNWTAAWHTRYMEWVGTHFWMDTEHTLFFEAWNSIGRRETTGCAVLYIACYLYILVNDGWTKSYEYLATNGHSHGSELVRVFSEATVINNVGIFRAHQVYYTGLWILSAVASALCSLRWWIRSAQLSIVFACCVVGWTAAMGALYAAWNAYTAFQGIGSCMSMACQALAELKMYVIGKPAAGRGRKKAPAQGNAAAGAVAKVVGACECVAVCVPDVLPYMAAWAYGSIFVTDTLLAILAMFIIFVNDWRIFAFVMCVAWRVSRLRPEYVVPAAAVLCVLPAVSCYHGIGVACPGDVPCTGTQSLLLVAVHVLWCGGILTSSGYVSLLVKAPGLALLQLAAHRFKPHRR